MVEVGKGTKRIGLGCDCQGHRKVTNLKKLEVSPILYPMTSLLSRVPSTSNTSITGPYLDSTFHIT